MNAEETYYWDGTNLITNERLSFAGTEYLLGDALNVEVIATFPTEIALLRSAIIPTLAALLAVAILLDGQHDNPLIASIILVVDIACTVGFSACALYDLLGRYRKHPSRGAAFRSAGLVLLLLGVIGWWFLFNSERASLGAAWVLLAGAGGTSLFHFLDRYGTFSIRMIEPARRVLVFSSTDRQLVQKLTGYIRLALIKRANLTKSATKSAP